MGLEVFSDLERVPWYVMRVVLMSNLSMCGWTGSPLCMDQQLCRPQQLQSLLPLCPVCSGCKFTVHGVLPPYLVLWGLPSLT